jgi:hypothetical protein
VTAVELTAPVRALYSAPSRRSSRSAPARRFGRQHWVPLLLLALLAGLTVGGINGSSTAATRAELGSQVSSDPHLLAGSPRWIRADEWAINTPLSIMQVRTGSPRIQPLMGDGADMALSYDVPVADQWALFRPQHWGFLVMPLAQGFAFHWWFPALLLVFALWLLTVTLLPGRNTLGLLIGAAAVFSPFMQWWYLAGSFLPEALAILACALFIRILTAPSRRWLAVHSVSMAWVLTSFALLLYPPFQLPCALVALAFCLGYLLVATRGAGWRPLLLRLGVVFACTAAAGACLLLFLLDHRVAVQAIASSVYPGQRTVESGGYSVSRLFSGFLDRRLTSEAAAKSIDVNQSEASSPLLAGLLALPVLAWLVISSIRRRQRPNPVLVLLLAVLGLFLVQLFVPDMSLLSKVTLLDRVPANRLLLALGMLSDVLLVTIAWQVNSSPRCSRRVVLGAFGAPLIVLLGLTFYLHVGHAVFVGSLVIAVLLAAIIAAAVALWTTRRPEFGAALLLVLSFMVTGAVNPISVGVSTTEELPIGTAVAMVDRAAPGGWIMELNRLPMGVLTEQAIHSYSVIYNYPQIELWRELDPTGAHSERYNRYGFADFQLHPGPTHFVEYSADQFSIAIDGCDSFVQKRVKHVLSARLLDSGCVRVRQALVSGSQEFYIYDVVPPVPASAFNPFG